MPQIRYTLSEIAALLNATETEAHSILQKENILLPEDGVLSPGMERKIRCLLVRHMQARSAMQAGRDAAHPIQEEKSSKPDAPEGSRIQRGDGKGRGNAHHTIPQISMELCGGTVSDSSVSDVPAAPLLDAPLPPELSAETHPSAENVKADGEAGVWEQLVSGYVIMIDTCSLMHKGCGAVLSGLMPALMRRKKKIVIPRQVLLELERLQASGCADKTASAHRALCMCRRLRDAGCLDVRGDSGEHFADNVFFVNILHYRTRHQILLITQDRKLAYDTLRLNEFRSAEGFPVTVMRILDSGLLREFVPAALQR